LVDFGLVKIMSPDQEMTITVIQGLGTALYTPLEQYGSDEIHTDTRPTYTPSARRSAMSSRTSHGGRPQALHYSNRSSRVAQLSSRRTEQAIL
jgi:hypothetical protein